MGFKAEFDKDKLKEAESSSGSGNTVLPEGTYTAVIEEAELRFFGRDKIYAKLAIGTSFGEPQGLRVYENGEVVKRLYFEDVFLGEYLGDKTKEQLNEDPKKAAKNLHINPSNSATWFLSKLKFVDNEGNAVNGLDTLPIQEAVIGRAARIKVGFSGYIKGVQSWNSPYKFRNEFNGGEEWGSVEAAQRFALQYNIENDYSSLEYEGEEVTSVTDEIWEAHKAQKTSFTSESDAPRLMVVNGVDGWYEVTKQQAEACGLTYADGYAYDPKLVKNTKPKKAAW